MRHIDLDRLDSRPSGRQDWSGVVYDHKGNVVAEDPSTGFHIQPPNTRNLQRHRKPRGISNMRGVGRPRASKVISFTPASVHASVHRPARRSLTDIIATCDRFRSIDTNTIVNVYRARPSTATIVNVETNSTFRGA